MYKGRKFSQVYKNYLKITITFSEISEKRGLFSFYILYTFIVYILCSPVHQDTFLNGYVEHVNIYLNQQLIFKLHQKTYSF